VESTELDPALAACDWCSTRPSRDAQCCSYRIYERFKEYWSKLNELRANKELSEEQKGTEARKLTKDWTTDRDKLVGPVKQQTSAAWGERKRWHMEVFPEERPEESDPKKRK
jgi:hypothetical protein